MLKLSEPQERMLRMMEQHKVRVSVHIWDDGYWGTAWVTSDPSWPRSARSMRRPNVRTMQALERRGLLEREAKGPSDFHFVLTPEGHAIAKELQDAKAE